MKTDLEIAQENTIDNIEKIARKAKIDPDFLELYGKTKAKIDLKIIAGNTSERVKIAEIVKPLCLVIVSYGAYSV